MRNLDNATAGGSRPETAEDIANQAIKDAKLAEDQVIAGQLQGTTGGMWRAGVEDVLAARGQGAASHAKEKKKQDDFHFQIRVQRLLEELQERIEELTKQLEELIREQASLRKESDQEFNEANELDDLIKALEEDKQLTPEQQKIYDAYKKKDPDADKNDIIQAILADQNRLNASATKKALDADALDDQIDATKSEIDGLSSILGDVEIAKQNGYEDDPSIDLAEAKIQDLEQQVKNLGDSAEMDAQFEYDLGF